LLVALFPALLILAASGLSRLEDRLVGGMLIGGEETRRLDCSHRRHTGHVTGELAHRSSRGERFVDPLQVFTADPRGLPAGRHRHSRANRQYGQTGQYRHANRV
jgi:hypothetical protein